MKATSAIAVLACATSVLAFPESKANDPATPSPTSSTTSSTSSSTTSVASSTSSPAGYGNYASYGSYGTYTTYSRSAEAEADIEALLNLAFAIKAKREAEAST